MTTVSVSKARSDFASIVNQVAFGKERIAVGRRGKIRVAIVPIEDVELLEQLEAKADLELIRERLSEPTEPWEQVKAELGL